MDVRWTDATEGWSNLFGCLITPGEVSTLPPELATLAVEDGIAEVVHQTEDNADGPVDPEEE